MSIWARDTEHEKRYGYQVYRAGFGPYGIMIREERNHTWGAEWVGHYDEWEYTIGFAATFEEAQRLVLAWVRERLAEATEQLVEAEAEWANGGG